MTDISKTDYLERGNEIQKALAEVFRSHRILEKLSLFDPVLVGTIPLQINIPGSDADILCCYQDESAFYACITEAFGAATDFRLRSLLKAGQQTILANFSLSGFDFEIFGQHTPVKEQLGYRHMIIEQRLLEQHGDSLREIIIGLKLQGFKTEPAFCKWLGLEGDPYTALLTLEI